VRQAHLLDGGAEPLEHLDRRANGTFDGRLHPGNEILPGHPDAHAVHAALQAGDVIRHRVL